MKFCFESRQFIEVDINPDKNAVIGENVTLSWQEFKESVECLSEFLNENIRPTKRLPIIIYGHKNAEMVSAMYACMRQQITYIPIDKVYPRERLERIVAISGAQLIINCSGKESLSIKGILEIQYTIGQAFQSPPEVHAPKHQPHQYLPTLDPLVYIIFTSGSTGEPKGVQISSQAILSFVEWMTQDFGFSQEDVFANVAVFSFDLSVFELMTFGALGASLLLNGKSSLENTAVFTQRITEHQATVWVSTPSFALMYARETIPEIAKNIKSFLFCGEVLPHALAASLKNHYPNAKVWNTYGPTEATVATTLIEIDDALLEKYSMLPVGFPKRNCEIHIEDNEIVIQGEHVALGYLNRPDLNEIKFGIRQGQRFFKTGDLGYFEDNMLFCKGRNDDQIKLRGFRIELNEITAKIDDLPFVEKSATIPLKRNEEVKKIVSLITLKHSVDFDVKKTIHEHLTKFLPEYMIPSDFKLIDSIPLNQNGKADRNRLLEMYLMK